MVKIRRNRQPKDWQKMTKERSNSGLLASNVDNRVSMLTPESQLTKVNRNLKKLRKNIDNHKKEKDKSETTLGRKTWLEGAIHKLEKRLTKLIIVEMSLKDKIEKSLARFDKKKTDEKQKQAVSKVNSEKIKPGIRKDFSTGFHPGLAGKGKIKEFVEVNGGKRRVRRKFMTEERASPEKNTGSGKVKVTNPNRKGTIFLKPKPKKGD